MKHLTVVAAALLTLSACGKEDAVPPAPTTPTAAGRPDKMPNGEPAVVTVKHVLIAFAGSARSQATRTKEEAQNMAYEILNRAKTGEDFDKLMKESNDPGEGTYTMVNEGLRANENAQPPEFDRATMAKWFGDVSFRIAVGEIGIAEYHPTDSGFGWHIIKRIK